MSILYKGARVGSVHTSVLDPIVTQEAGNSEVHVMSQKAATASFANALKGRALGQVVTLDDVAPAPVKIKVESKNLLKYPYRAIEPHGTKTLNGVVFTDNGDGTITAKGTATAALELLLTDGISYGDASAYGVSGVDTKNGYTFKDCDYYQSTKSTVIYVAKGAIVDRTYQPQIERAATASVFTSPIADGTVVNVKTCGKNLFTMNAFDQKKDDYELQNGFYVSKKKYLPAGVYVWSGKNFSSSIEGINVALINSNGVLAYLVKSGVIVTKVSVNSDTDIYLGINYTPTLFFEESTLEGQVERGTTATAYEPYIEVQAGVVPIGGRLLPYPFKTGTTTISGVTFVDDGHGKIIVNGTATETVFYMLQDYGKNKDKVYAQDVVLAGCPSGGTIGTYRLACSNSQGASKSDVGKGVTLPAGWPYRDVYIRIGRGCTVNNLVFEPRIEFAAGTGGIKTTFTGEDIELEPIAPNMGIFVDEVGAQLDVRYNKDPNVVIDKLIQVLISLGGNI